MVDDGPAQRNLDVYDTKNGLWNPDLGELECAQGWELAGRTLMRCCVGAGVRLDFGQAPFDEITTECPLTLRLASCDSGACASTSDRGWGSRPMRPTCVIESCQHPDGAATQPVIRTSNVRW
jgi:hypothetical protein